MSFRSNRPFAFPRLGVFFAAFPDEILGLVLTSDPHVSRLYPLLAVSRRFRTLLRETCRQVDCSRTPVSSESILSACRPFPRANSFALCRCPRLDWAAVGQLLRWCDREGRPLERLDCSGSLYLSRPQGILARLAAGSLAGCWREVRQLSLDGIAALGPGDLLPVLAAAPALQRLNLTQTTVLWQNPPARPPHPEGAVGPLVGTLAARCPALTHLWLGSAPWLGDRDLVALGSLSGLQELVIFRAALTDQALHAFCKASAAGASLECLELCWCPGLSDGCMEPLASLPRLRRLSLRGCPRLTGLALFLLATHPGAAALEALDMRDCVALRVGPLFTSRLLEGHPALGRLLLDRAAWRADDPPPAPPVAPRSSTGTSGSLVGRVVQLEGLLPAPPSPARSPEATSRPRQPDRRSAPPPFLPLPIPRPPVHGPGAGPPGAAESDEDLLLAALAQCFGTRGSAHSGSPHDDGQPP
ncbi:hypothetical protein PAPYR_5679 [Paratrimastix pyriformis]|uniref:Uncharacterized protein n=1 Tax=Paratrimastix pyriformis TaxID=342808 RepID=A0ABQ8UJU1_9EUKA|nr:hypothetical protein PAPYR_5679 [Paratrimastix pyriformis]